MGFYVFRVLLAHPQEVLKNDTWYIVCVLCQLGATRIEVEQFHFTPGNSQLT
jgi:hypothetical protein